ncbi:MAG: TetR/AcrR family transcriptional regulator [Emcibacter sp.]|nr:TetR/AcrR family transcriptional regulator [Emcibacter sp.]
MDILKEGTLADLSLRALARKAGVSQTAPYRHFKDKEALIAALKEEGMRKLGEGMQKLMEEEKDPLQRLQKLGMRYVQFAEKYPAHFKIMFEYELGDYDKYTELHNVSDNGFSCLQRTVNECLALPGARKVAPAVAQFSAWSMVHGLSVLLMNQSLIKHMKEDHFVDLGDRNQIAEMVTRSFSESLVK